VSIFWNIDELIIPLLFLNKRAGPFVTDPQMLSSSALLNMFNDDDVLTTETFEN
jgi:hypothetical protein